MTAPPAVAVGLQKDDTGVFVPKNDIATKHKVVRFGFLKTGAESVEEENLYKFLHQRADLQVSKGSIPVDFLAYLPLQEGSPLYLETRDGGWNERGQPVGPLYQCSWRNDREVIGGTHGESWTNNLDTLWESVLAHFERKNLITEESELDYLDADPFVLFGIDDMVTQQALQKLEKFPALLCENATPAFDEWAHYIRVDPMDTDLKWLVQAFAETELPKPWTCYKGVGSIVCYIRSDTGQVTWKHPFYDYFRQLREFCRSSIDENHPEDIMLVRVNRLLWSYEATRVETEHNMEPLVSPEYLSRLADIFGYDAKVHGCCVRNLKAQLKVFARSYRVKQECDLADVITCASVLQRDVEKHEEMQDHWQNQVKNEVQFDLKELSDGEIVCVNGGPNCGKTALCFCLECKDYLCLACYQGLHNKGARLTHSPFRLVSCSLCFHKPAKLQCTFTDKSLCHRCYAMDHIKLLPPDGKENQPRRIDYIQQYSRYSQIARDRARKSGVPSSSMDFASKENEEGYAAVLSTDWHPFYDARGVKYYHNFLTGERMRQSPRRVPNTADPGVNPEDTEGMDITSPLAKAAEATGRPGTSSSGPGSVTAKRAAMSELDKIKATHKDLMGATQPMDLNGFDALETFPSAHVGAATLPDFRTVRPPHRAHMPQQIPA